MTAEMRSVSGASALGKLVPSHKRIKLLPLGRGHCDDALGHEVQ